MKWNNGTSPNFNFSDLFYIFKNFGNEKVGFCGGSTQLFCILPLWFFLHKASTCAEDHNRDFSNPFSILIYVPIVQIWITGIKRQENAVNPLNIANEPRKIPNLHSHDFMVYVEYRKKIICKQQRYVNYLSKFKRFPLETMKLHRRWFDLWRL